MSFPTPFIFDLDGTLWDASPITAKSWGDVVRNVGIPIRITKEAVRRVTGKPQAECINTLLGDYATPTLIDQLTQAEEHALAQTGGRLYPSVKTHIRALAQQHPLGIVSNCETGYLELFLQRSGLRDCFTICDCAGQSRTSKADMLRRIGGGTYVGDTEGDRIAARTANMPFVHATYGFGDVTEADASARSFREVAHLLDGSH